MKVVVVLAPNPESGVTEQPKGYESKELIVHNTDDGYLIVNKKDDVGRIQTIAVFAPKAWSYYETVEV